MEQNLEFKNLSTKNKINNMFKCYCFRISFKKKVVKLNEQNKMYCIYQLEPGPPVGVCMYCISTLLLNTLTNKLMAAAFTEQINMHLFTNRRIKYRENTLTNGARRKYSKRQKLKFIVARPSRTAFKTKNNKKKSKPHLRLSYRIELNYLSLIVRRYGLFSLFRIRWCTPTDGAEHVYDHDSQNDGLGIIFFFLKSNRQ